MNEIKKLREKYNMYLSKRDYTKAVEVMKKINSLSQIYEERREVAVKSLFDSLSEEDVNKATELCTFLTIYADLLQSAATDLQSILTRADDSAELALLYDVKKVIKTTNNIVQIIDSFNDDEFSESFGDMCDLIAINVKNIFYSVQMKYKRNDNRGLKK